MAVILYSYLGAKNPSLQKALQQQHHQQNVSKNELFYHR